METERCTLCTERPQLSDSVLELCGRCAEMIFEVLCQEALASETKDELDIQEEQANG